MFLWVFPSCHSVRSWSVDPNPTLRPDTLLHKPSVCCCLSTRAACMDYWWQHIASEGMAHGKDTPVTHAASNHPVEYFRAHSFCCKYLVFSGDSLFLCTQPQLPVPTIHSYHPPPPLPPPSWALISHSVPHSRHTCISDYAQRAEVIPAWISILMGCPLCPCFLSLRFYSSEGRWRVSDAEREEE